MKIFILIGHPNSDPTLGSSFADTYEKEALASGHQVTKLHIAKLQFDPILHKGYKAIQALEPDLVQVQQHIKECDTFVLIYPLWWSSAPSLLKGMVDRMWLPGFAFRFIKAPDGKTTMGWQKLLKGKKARVIITMKNFPIVERFMFGDYAAEIVDAVLRFSGFKVSLTEVGNAEALSKDAIARWHKRIGVLGRKGI